MLIHLVAFVAGLALLMGGSDRFVAGAAGIARILGISPMVVRLTVVAIGTLAPELLVSAMAAAAGSPGIAIGNVVGSNITNITLVVGASAVAAPLLVASQSLRREFPLLFAVSALAWLLIGLTVVAIGTSLPELAASLASALRGEPDIAIGNVLGSNMFNLLPVLGIAGLVQPFRLDPEVLTRDLPIMAALTVVLFFMCVGRRGPGRVSRTERGAADHVRRLPGRALRRARRVSRGERAAAEGERA